MSQTDADGAARLEARKGVLFAFLAFTLWGTSAWFYKHLEDVDPFQIVAHRILWSIPIAAVVLVLIGRTHDLKRAFTTPRIVAILAITTVLVSVNWLVFVIAVMEGWAIEASLGYFINPLVNVLLGMVLLGERLSRWQWVAVALAASGVALQTWQFGSLPWVGLFLAFTFAAYGYIRKTIDIGPAQGFLVETVLLMPFALAYVVYAVGQGTNTFHPLDAPGLTIFLVLCGPMTAGPLIFFSAAARRLTLATLGLMQYLAPSMIFLTAIFILGEPLGTAKLVSFSLIWLALAVFSFSAWREERGRRAAAG
jgi:chloramphenicol-sensitive protein RarD